MEYVVEVTETGRLARRVRDGRRVEFVVEVLETGTLIARTRDDRICATGETLRVLRSNASAAVRENLGEDRAIALLMTTPERFFGA